jgi:hypothetical protein
VPVPIVGSSLRLKVLSKNAIAVFLIDGDAGYDHVSEKCEPTSAPVAPIGSNTLSVIGYTGHDSSVDAATVWITSDDNHH